MKTNLIVLFFALVPFCSCISDEESARQVNSGFQGDWKGTLNGDENGSITFVVEKDGNITGEIDMIPSTGVEVIKGYVNFDGKFDMNTKSNLKFSGYLKGMESSGIWTKNELKGNFNFQKK